MAAKKSRKGSKSSSKKPRKATKAGRSRGVAAETIQVEGGTGRMMANGQRCYWIIVVDPDGTRRRVKVCE